ncbi:MAG: hypothetical protein HWN65_22695 [Candidatus Helarchaeota archaeon]|nr:hypothetical protein [Candidatus Helarchaeota archaeon]
MGRRKIARLKKRLVKEYPDPVTVVDPRLVALVDELPLPEERRRQVLSDVAVLAGEDVEAAAEMLAELVELDLEDLANLKENCHTS